MKGLKFLRVLRGIALASFVILAFVQICQPDLYIFVVDALVNLGLTDLTLEVFRDQIMVDVLNYVILTWLALIVISIIYRIILAIVRKARNRKHKVVKAKPIKEVKKVEEPKKVEKVQPATEEKTAAPAVTEKKDDFLSSLKNLHR